MASKNYSGELGDISVITHLRGIAALGVLIFHLSIPNKYISSLDFSTLTNLFGDEVGRFFWIGEYGVEIFFIISGFILPYSLFRSEFVINRLPRFLIRRYIRISIPYIAAIIVCWLLLFIIPTVIGNVFIDNPERFTIDSLLFHLTFTIPFTNFDWYDSVYWTLAIEFQFYIIIGFIFRFLSKKYVLFLMVIFIPIACIPHLNYYGILAYLFYFFVGIYIYSHFLRILSKKELYVLVGIAALIASFSNYDLVGVGLAIIVALIVPNLIANPIKSVYLLVLGRISYSLYITHTFILICTHIILKRLFSDPSEIGSIGISILYVAICILFAYFFEKNIERPALKLSKRLKWRSP